MLKMFLWTCKKEISERQFLSKFVSIRLKFSFFRRQVAYNSVSVLRDLISDATFIDKNLYTTALLASFVVNQDIKNFSLSLSSFS